MLLFWLQRIEDESGVSGVGLVAEGVIFSDGKVALKWLTETSSVGIYNSIEDVITIHGHNGKTQIIYEDEECERLANGESWYEKDYDENEW